MYEAHVKEGSKYLEVLVRKTKRKQLAMVVSEESIIDRTLVDGGKYQGVWDSEQGVMVSIAIAVKDVAERKR